MVILFSLNSKYSTQHFLESPVQHTEQKIIVIQGRSQPHIPGWARLPLSSFFSSNFDQFILFFLKLYSFSSSFWFSGWAARPPGKALGTPLLLFAAWKETETIIACTVRVYIVISKIICRARENMQFKKVKKEIINCKKRDFAPTYRFYAKNRVFLQIERNVVQKSIRMHKF